MLMLQHTIYIRCLAGKRVSYVITVEGRRTHQSAVDVCRNINKNRERKKNNHEDAEVEFVTREAKNLQQSSSQGGNNRLKVTMIKTGSRPKNSIIYDHLRRKNYIFNYLIHWSTWNKAYKVYDWKHNMFIIIATRIYIFGNNNNNPRERGETARLLMLTKGACCCCWSSSVGSTIIDNNNKIYLKTALFFGGQVTCLLFWLGALLYNIFNPVCILCERSTWVRHPSSINLRIDKTPSRLEKFLPDGDDDDDASIRPKRTCWCRPAPSGCDLMCRSGARVTSESRGVPGGSTNSARATTLYYPASCSS